MILLKLIPYLIISLILGSAIKILEKNNIINRLCFFLMNYSKFNYATMNIYIIKYIQYLLIIIISMIIIIIKKQNILFYLKIEKEYIIYIFINILAIISAFELILSILTLINKNIKTNIIFKNILSIPSVDLLYSSTNNPKWTLIIISSIIKSFFFNGIIYIAIRDIFINYNIFFTIIIVGLLFSLEEIFQVINIIQVLIVTIICFIIIMINSFSLEYTKSLIPSIMSTLAFSMYYFGQFENIRSKKWY